MIGALLIAAAAVLSAAASPADRVAFAPRERALLPSDARFVDEYGHALRLRDLLASRPAIVVPAYYGCSNLCGIVLHGVAASLSASGLRAGRDLDVVAVSIAPLEQPADALASKRSIAGAGDGWHFLTGEASAVARFADALGYRYFYDQAERQYAHAAGIAIVAPGGRIVRVLYGVTFARADLLDALDAARDAAAPPSAATAAAARTWLLCFHYDPHTGRYSFAAISAVRAAALAALLAFIAYVVYTGTRGRRR